MTVGAPTVAPPPPRLDAVPPARRRAVLAAVTASTEPSAAAVAWVEKVRRLASLHRGRLRRVARRRFGADAAAQLSWMARLLLEGAVRHPARGAAPVDAASLSAALYCLDAAPGHAGTLDRANRAVDAVRDWAAGGGQPPARSALGRDFAYGPGRWRAEASGVLPVVIFAPTPVGLNALAVLDLCRRLDVPVAAVVLRRFTVRRLRAEWRRHGPRLLRRVGRKLILRGDEHPDRVDASLADLVERLVAGRRHLRRRASAWGVPVRGVDDFGDAADDPAVTGRRIGLFTGGGVLPGPLLEAFAAGGGVINVHTGHLPCYRGMDGVPAAVLEGRPAGVGLTAHFMTPEIDAGDVLSRFTLDPARYPTAGALGNALATLMPLMLVDAALGVGSGRLRRIPQPAAGRRHYPLHPRLRPIVDDGLAAQHARAGLRGPSPVRRTIDAVCADLTR